MHNLAEMLPVFDIILNLLYRVRDLSHQNIVICYILFSLKKQLPKPQSKLHKLSNLWQADAYLLS